MHSWCWHTDVKFLAYEVSVLDSVDCGKHFSIAGNNLINLNPALLRVFPPQFNYVVSV